MDGVTKQGNTHEGMFEGLVIDTSRSEGETEAKKQHEEVTWINEEMVAVGELKREIMAVKFPEDFDGDSDLTSPKTNIWLPARLHPEIAPEEFQELLKKHGAKYEKIETNVVRRKSMLSYGDGTNDFEEGEGQVGLGGDKPIIPINKGAAYRFSEEGLRELAPFMLADGPRTSLKRSKLQNKRRDSGVGNKNKRRDGRVSDTGVREIYEEHRRSSTGGIQDTVKVDNKRVSTQEILSQITREVEKFSTDDLGFDLVEAQKYKGERVRKEQKGGEIKAKDKEKEKEGGKEKEKEKEKTREKIEEEFGGHSKWWTTAKVKEEIIRSDLEKLKVKEKEREREKEKEKVKEREKEKEREREREREREKSVMISTATTVVGSKSGAEPENVSLKDKKTKLPSAISFLMFGKGKSTGSSKQKEGNRNESGGDKTGKAATATTTGEVAKKGKGKGEGENAQAGKTKGVVDVKMQQGIGIGAGAGVGRGEAGGNGNSSRLPSILTPTRPPPSSARFGMNFNRLPIHVERAIYRLASIKLSNPRRPLLQQVLLSNMMFWYLELINPRSTTPTRQQQQQQQQNGSENNNYYVPQQNYSNTNNKDYQKSKGENTASGQPSSPQNSKSGAKKSADSRNTGSEREKTVKSPSILAPLPLSLPSQMSLSPSPSPSSPQKQQVAPPLPPSQKTVDRQKSGSLSKDTSKTNMNSKPIENTVINNKNKSSGDRQDRKSSSGAISNEKSLENEAKNRYRKSSEVSRKDQAEYLSQKIPNSNSNLNQISKTSGNEAKKTSQFSYYQPQSMIYSASSPPPPSLPSVQAGKSGSAIENIYHSPNPESLSHRQHHHPLPHPPQKNPPPQPPTNPKSTSSTSSNKRNSLFFDFADDETPLAAYNIHK